MMSVGLNSRIGVQKTRAFRGLITLCDVSQVRLYRNTVDTLPAEFTDVTDAVFRSATK
jgi:hypothetical protein